ncbi:mucin TcMUCII, putative [Trypanosoma cruzi]|nr:mucin TcMUCII, putative [Trypanosoma cruzi]
MPFHAAINRSEGAFWCVGVHSHIFISTAINSEESGATATKGETNIYCNTLPAKGRNNTNRIVGITSRRPTIHVVCGDHSFFNCYFAFVLLCVLHLFLLCVRILREGCRHDGPLSPYAHAVEPCVPLLFASPSSIFVCCCCGRAVCVCTCCRGLECVSCVVYGVRCMRGCCPLLVWCALCVCLPHLSSPLLLSMPLTVQISSTPLNDHTRDDDVPSAVRPVGARPVLLPVRVRNSG